MAQIADGLHGVIALGVELTGSLLDDPSDFCVDD